MTTTKIVFRLIIETKVIHSHNKSLTSTFSFPVL